MQSTFQTLTQFAQEIDRRETSKQDYVVPANQLSFTNKSHVYFNGQELEPTDRFHCQMSEKLSIPKKYYDRMRAEEPELLQHNVNTWLGKSDKSHMVRTLDNKARAFLSDRYRPIDNALVMGALLPNVAGMDNIQIKTQSMSDDRLYFQLIFKNMQADIKQGDTVSWGLSFTNSEVGLSAFDIKTFLFRLVCKNGMVGQSLIRQYHVGRRVGANEEDYSLFKDDTIEAELQSLRLRTRDIISNAISGDLFPSMVAKLQEATGDIITKPVETIENVTKRFSLSASLNEMVMENMAREQDFSRYGLANGITALAHKLDNLDAQYEVEKVGSRIIELTSKEWKEVAA